MRLKQLDKKFIVYNPELRNCLVIKCFDLGTSRSKNFEAYQQSKSAEKFLQRRSPSQNLAIEVNFVIQSL